MIDKTTEKLARQVVKILTERKETVSAAESFTGGGIASAIVSIAGASKVLKEGLVTYTVESKVLRLGVSRDTVEKFGVVSKEVALEMARGVLASPLKPDYAVSATGNVGPSNEPNTDPCVGYVAVAWRDGAEAVKLSLTGNRADNIASGVDNALALLLKIVK